MDVPPVVFVISGDSKARRNLSSRLKQFGYDPLPCHSPEEFQQNSLPHDAGCIVLHVAHADIDLDWLASLGPPEDHWPVIGIAGAADVETAVLAMKRGAFDFLLEACSDQRLREAVADALRWNAVERKHITQVQSIRRRLKLLTAAHRDVLDLLIKGKSNREIADELGMSVRSIEVRRAKLMRTMKARNLVSLLRKTLLAQGVAPARWLPAAGEDRASELHPVAPNSYGSPPE